MSYAHVNKKWLERGCIVYEEEKETKDYRLSLSFEHYMYLGLDFLKCTLLVFVFFLNSYIWSLNF